MRKIVNRIFPRDCWRAALCKLSKFQQAVFLTAIDQSRPTKPGPHKLWIAFWGRRYLRGLVSLPARILPRARRCIKYLHLKWRCPSSWCRRGPPGTRRCPAPPSRCSRAAGERPRRCPRASRRARALETPTYVAHVPVSDCPDGGGAASHESGERESRASRPRTPPQQQQQQRRRRRTRA